MLWLWVACWNAAALFCGSAAQPSSDECSWRGSGLSHQPHLRDVEQIYLRCSQGFLTWLYPTGALILNLRPNTEPWSGGTTGLHACIKPRADSKGPGAHMYPYLHSGTAFSDADLGVCRLLASEDQPNLAVAGRGVIRGVVRSSPSSSSVDDGHVSVAPAPAVWRGPGEDDQYLLTGSVHFGEVWMGCAPLYKDFLERYQVAQEAEVQFDMSELQLKEVREVVRKARASSAPGPSGTSYKVYKYCPKLLLRLWYILRVFWRRGRIPDQWRVAEGVWIPKEENSTQLDQFHIISLLCVEAKLIREARENKGNLSVLWLDLENAFGSIPHKLVQFTLTKHHVPSRCRDLIADYYSNFRMRVSSGAITSSWHKVEIGIITGCTISVTLFSLAMNMLTKSAEPECRGPRTNSGQRQPPIRAFMDDLTVMTESVPGCRWILKGLEELVEWAPMRFKSAKSRSMVLRKGKVVDKFRFNIADTAIPSISEKPVKSLGKVFDCSLRDTTSIQSTCTELDGWLKSVD
ncbi:hypothetical protein NHX12_018456, partial [Muraenolepis orangiensis]